MYKKMEAPQDIEQFVLCVLLYACKHCHVHCYLTSVAVKQTLRWDCMTPIARAGLSMVKINIAVLAPTAHTEYAVSCAEVCA